MLASRHLPVRVGACRDPGRTYFGRVDLLLWRPRRWRYFAVLTGAFVAPSILLVAGGTASAQTTKSSASKAGIEVKLTKEHREAFKEGAKKAAGLSDARIAAALKDPAALRAIPVSATA